MEDQRVEEKQDPFEFITAATPSMGLWSHGVHLGWKEEALEVKVPELREQSLLFV